MAYLHLLQVQHVQFVCTWMYPHRLLIGYVAQDTHNRHKIVLGRPRGTSTVCTHVKQYETFLLLFFYTQGAVSSKGV